MTCQTSLRSVKPFPRYGEFRFFKMAAVRHLGFVVCMYIRTTHEGHLVDFIAVQNLVGIGAVVLIICTFIDFASLA